MAFRIVGAVAVRVRPDTTKFSRELREQLEKKEDEDVFVPVHPREKGFQADIIRLVRKTNADLDARDVAIRVPGRLRDTDLLSAARKAVNEANQKIKATGLALRIPLLVDDRQVIDSLKDALRKAKVALKRERLAVEVDLTLDRTKAEAEMKRFVDKYNDTQLDLNVNLDRRGRFAAQMALLTRNRYVDIHPRINKPAFATAMAALEALAGVNIMRDIKNRVKNIVTNLDTLALSVGKFGVLAGNFTALGLQMAASLATIGSSLGQLGGFALALPAAGAGILAFATASVAALKNFKGAIDGNADALKALPEQAREAAKALQGTWTSIQVPTQAAFWSQMGHSLQESVDTVIGSIRRGMTKVGESSGAMAAEALSSFVDLADRGDMDRMFDGLAAGIKNAARGARPLMDAINRIGLSGARYMPKVGEYLANAARSFEQWIRLADQSGRLDQWLQNAVDTAGEVKTVFKDIVGIFGAIADAAKAGGSYGLESLEKSLGKVRKIVESNPFQQGLSTLFQGAREGVDALSVGVGKLGHALGDMAPTLASTMATVGRTASALLAGIGAGISTVGFQRGLTDLFDGLERGVKSFVEYMPQIGELVGDIASIAGSLVSSALPLVGQALGVIRDVVTELKDPLKAVSETLMGSMSSAIGVLGTILPPLASVMGSLLTVVAALPEPLIAMAAAFWLLRGRVAGIGRLMQGAGRSMSGLFRGFTGRASTLGAEMAAAGKFAAAGVVRGFQEGLRGMIPSIRHAVSTDPFRNLLTSFRATAASITARATVLGGAIVRGVGRGISGITSLLGGPWGLAFLGALSVVQNISSEAQKTKQAYQDAARVAAELGRLKAVNPFGDSGDEGIAKAEEAVQSLIDKVREVNPAMADILGTQRQGLMDHFLGDSTAAGVQALGVLRQVQGVMDKIDGDAVSRAVENLGPFSNGSEKAYEASLALGIFEDAASGANKIMGELGKTAKVNLERNLDLAGITIEKFGKVTPETLKAVGASMTDLEGKPLDSMEGFAEFISQTLSGTDAEIKARTPAILNGLKTFGDAPNEIARFLTGMGYNSREITSVLTGLGLDTEEAATAIRTQFGVVESATGRMLTVLGEAVPKMSPLSDGMKEYAAALAGVTSVDATTLESTFDRVGTSAGQVAESLARQGVGMGAIKEVLDAMGVPAATAATAMARVATAMSRMDGVNPQKAEAFGQALKDIALNADDAEDATSRLRDAIDLLNGGTLSTERIQSTFAASLQGATEAIKAFNKESQNDAGETVVEKFKDWASVIDPLTGQINTMTEEGRGLFDAVDQLSRDAMTSAQDAFQKTFERTGSYTKAMKDATSATSTQIDSFKEAAKQAGFTDTEIDALIRRYNLVPEKISTDVYAQTLSAESSIGKVIGLINNAKAGAKIPLSATDAPAVAVLERVGIKVKRFSDGTYQAQLSADPKKAQDQIAALQSYISTRQFTAYLQIQSNIASVIASIQAALNLALGFLFANGGIVERGVQTFANGGFAGKRLGRLTAFAGGGLSNKPTSAHIAKAGSYVMYAEKETGGEAFIPLSPFKRTRSVQILAEVARRFGLTLAAQNGAVVRKFANGSSDTDGTVHSGGNTFQITNYYPQAEPTSRTVARAGRMAASIA